MPSLPPAIWSTTRMVESLPVTTCVAESAASLCKAVSVLARNAGTVHDRALPSTVDRRNSRRVWSVISFFITTSCDLICRGGHHEPDGREDVRVIQLGLGAEKFTQRLFLLAFERRLQQPLFQRRHNGRLVGAIRRREDFFHIHAAHADALHGLHGFITTAASSLACKIPRGQRRQRALHQ